MIFITSCFQAKSGLHHIVVNIRVLQPRTYLAKHERKDGDAYHDLSGVDSGGCAVAGNWTDSNRNCLSASAGPRDGPQCCCEFSSCSQMESM